MNADEILKKHEDANEMHFHEVDRKWIIQAMEEYAALRQPPVISSLDLNELERKLDDALAKETTESLNEWLNEKRQ